MRQVFAAITAASVMTAPVLAQDKSTETEEPKPSAEKKFEGLFDFSSPSFLQMIQSMREQGADEQAFDTSKPVVGFAIGKTPTGMTIDRVLEGSAAESSGLEKGMVILRINGVSLKEFETEEVVKILGAIDGEIIFDIEGRGRYSLIKAPIPQDQGS